MSKKIVGILSFSIVLLLLFFVAHKTTTARDESARQSTFSESAFSESAFETKEVRGEEVEGVPDPPDENGPEIDTPLNDSFIDILLLLVGGSLVLLYARRKQLLKQ